MAYTVQLQDGSERILVKEGITDERLTAKLEELRSKPPAAYVPTQAGS